MTLEEVVKAVDGRKVCRHRGRCFINVRTNEDHDHFRSLGATSTPYPADGGSTGYEIYLREMLDPVFEEDEKGNQVDARDRTLLAFFRERDGFSIPLHQRAYERGIL